MRYKILTQLFTTVALAGALTLSAAPQTDNPDNLNQQVTTNTDESTTTAVVQPTAPMSDRRIERKIHKAISRDVTMSNRALLVRIVARNGQVTLKGSVPTNLEKQKIEDKAADLVGSANVVDRIKVKHPNYLG
jgi:osmotically-inducible protein OsmY